MRHDWSTMVPLQKTQRHAKTSGGYGPKSVECWTGGALVNLLRPAARVPRAARIETSELASAGYKTIMKSFDSFVKMIKGLEDLPLAVSSVIPASSALRYSSLFVPRPRDISEWFSVPNACKFIEPIEAIVQLEGSTHWPDDIAAIRQMKLAFYIKIAEVIEKDFPEVRTTVAAVHGDAEGYLDVAGGSGFVFRLRIQQEREKYLMEREISDSKTAPKRKAALQRLLRGYRRQYEHVPTHTALLQALCQHHPALSGTIRLAKRWLAAHGVLGEPHVSEELAELLAAHAFTDPSPYTIPACARAGFTRFLHRLAGWNWKAEPVSVDLERVEGSNGAWTAELRTQADEKFVALRAKEDAAIKASEKADATQRRRTWVVQTPRDTDGTAWTSPAPVVAGRIRALAKAAVKLMRASIASGSESAILNVFGHPTDAYDILLHLEKEKLARHYEAVRPMASLLRERPKRKFAEEDTPSDRMPMVAWDPAEEFLGDLRRAYSNVAHFFHDRYGGSTVFVVWNPNIREPRPWKPNLGFSTQIIATNGGEREPAAKESREERNKKRKKAPVPYAVANLDAIVTEMSRLGDGIEREVVFQT